MATVTQHERRITYTYADATSVPSSHRRRVASIVVGGVAAGSPSRTTTFAYDGARTTTVTAPGSVATTTAVDEHGNVTSLTPPGRTAHTFTYGRCDRIETYQPPVPAGGGAAAAWRTTYAHHVQGMPQTVARPEGAFEHSYSQGQLSSTLLPPSSAGGARSTLTYTYGKPRQSTWWINELCGLTFVSELHEAHWHDHHDTPSPRRPTTLRTTHRGDCTRVARRVCAQRDDAG